MKISFILVLLSIIFYMKKSDCSAVGKRPRVLPPMFLPTYGKRASDNEIPINEDEDDEPKYFDLRMIRQNQMSNLPNPYPLPPFVLRQPGSGRYGSSPSQFQRFVRRPPSTLPVMKRANFGYDTDSMENDYFQRYGRRPPTTLPVMKRYDGEASGEIEFVPVYQRVGRRPPTTLPVMKRQRSYLIEYDPYAYADEEYPFQRAIRRPPTTLPVMKRYWGDLEPEDVVYNRYVRRPPTTLPVMKRTGFWGELEPEEYERSVRRPPTTLPVMKRNYISDLYAAEKLGEDEYYKK